MEGEFYTVGEATRILRTTERTVRRRLERGDLEGARPHNVALEGSSPFRHRGAMPDRPPKPSSEPPEASESVRNYQQRVEDLQRQLGRLEGRLEIQEVAESTLREQLQRERGRADRLEEELRDAKRSWWSRIFGQ